MENLDEVLPIAIPSSIGSLGWRTQENNGIGELVDSWYNLVSTFLKISDVQSNIFMGRNTGQFRKLFCKLFGILKTRTYKFYETIFQGPLVTNEINGRIGLDCSLSLWQTRFPVDFVFSFSIISFISGVRVVLVTWRVLLSMSLVTFQLGITSTQLKFPPTKWVGINIFLSSVC